MQSKLEAENTGGNTGFNLHIFMVKVHSHFAFGTSYQHLSSNTQMIDVTSAKFCQRFK